MRNRRYLLFLSQIRRAQQQAGFLLVTLGSAFVTGTPISRQAFCGYFIARLMCQPLTGLLGISVGLSVLFLATPQQKCKDGSSKTALRNMYRAYRSKIVALCSVANIQERIKNIGSNS